MGLIKVDYGIVGGGIQLSSIEEYVFYRPSGGYYRAYIGENTSAWESDCPASGEYIGMSVSGTIVTFSCVKPCKVYIHKADQTNEIGDFKAGDTIYQVNYSTIPTGNLIMVSALI